MHRTFLAFGFMIAATAAASAMPLATLAQPSDVLAVHGCHQTWQHGHAGWHRHGSKCEFRRGVVDSTKRPVKPRKPSVRG
jgi:hypothetical protein